MHNRWQCGGRRCFSVTGETSPVPPQGNGGRSSRPTRPEGGRVAGGRGGRRKLASTSYDIVAAEGGERMELPEVL